jgi:hypothetical protein
MHSSSHTSYPSPHIHGATTRLQTFKMISRRRGPTSGTLQDIVELERKHPNLKAPHSYHIAMTQQLAPLQLMSGKLHDAQHSFDKQRYHMCRFKCIEITGIKHTSSAIEARAYMLLAKSEVTAIAGCRA